MSGELVPFPVIVAGIHHPVLGTHSQVAAGTGRSPAVVGRPQLNAATIGVQQYLVRIEAGTVVGTPGTLDAIGIALAQWNAFDMDVPDSRRCG
ncbi:hypothetical protein LGKMAHEF_02035 [Aeromonas salmonicida]